MHIHSSAKDGAEGEEEEEIFGNMYIHTNYVYYVYTYKL
jgi:hypothetical protein